VFDAAVERGATPGPKGRKPILGWTGEDESGEDSAVGAGTAGAGSDAVATAMADRIGTWRGRPYESPRTGPATAEDAWQWEGVPPGRSLIGRVEPGKMRYYMGDDGHGPSIRWLPAAWPPGGDDGGGGGG
jgi:hypothetical protein